MRSGNGHIQLGYRRWVTLSILWSTSYGHLCGVYRSSHLGGRTPSYATSGGKVGAQVGSWPPHRVMQKSGWLGYMRAAWEGRKKKSDSETVMEW